MRHATPTSRTLRPRAAGIAAALVALVGAASAVAQPAPSPSRAAELMRGRQYNDAIKVLSLEIANKPDEQVARQQLMLGECYYMTRQYEPARPLFVKAARNLTEEADRAIADYRVACVLFRLNDFANAGDKIDGFVARRPADPRAGKLLAYKMLIVAGRGKPAEAELEALHRRVADNFRRADAAVGAEADEILCDFYRKIGQDEKAFGLYSKAVLGFRKAIADLQQQKQPVPAALEKSHDNAALQLGLLCIDRKQGAEAVKWLENVRYDADLKAKARLLLAKVAYEKSDYRAAVAYLNDAAFVDAVADPLVRSDVMLLLGLSEKSLPDGNASKAADLLKKVAPESRGYAQARAALGDLYRERGLIDEAVKAYQSVAGNPDFAPAALLALANIHADLAAKSPDKPKAAALYKQSGEYLDQLLTKFPLSPQAKQGKDVAAALAKAGVPAGASAAGGDLVKSWEKAAAEKKGTPEAAQALTSLARYHFKTAADEKTRQVTRPPNYAACAAACDQFLDEKNYGGPTFAGPEWKALKAEAYYQRGLCELAGIGAAADAPGAVKNASPERAVAFLTSARQAVDPKQLDAVKGIELALLEAAFKSDKKESQELAERRFGELEADYGADPRFQKLALDLADWLRRQGRWADSAKQYVAVADRGKDLAKEDALKLLFTAGTLFSKAGYEAQTKTKDAGYAVYVYPKEAVDLGGDFLFNYPPFKQTIDLSAPAAGRPVPAREALRAVSKASGVPFVWAKPPSAIATYLDQQTVTLKEGRSTVAQALEAVLDTKVHRLAPDVGLADGPPTLDAPKSADEPGATRDRAPVEIYDARQADSRYKPLTRSYGTWGKAHGGSGKQSGPAVMLYNVLQRVEEISGTRIVWAEGVEKQEKLAAEYRQLPGFDNKADPTCAQVLSAALEPRELKWRVIRRDAAVEQYESAKDAFNKIRKLDAASKYGEKSLIAVALNYYNLHDYDKMKVVLREYLKLFDSPQNEYYHQACFWVGWCFENEQKYRDAIGYYARAAEERIVIAKPAAGKRPAREELKKSLSSDTQYALGEPARGEFKDVPLAKFADYVRFGLHVGARVDEGVDAGGTLVNRPGSGGGSGFDLLCDVLENAGLTFRVENVNAENAEKAYFRMAACYRKDNLLDQALESCELLLARYPKTDRQRDAQKLELGIYRGLKDYRRVLALLEDLRRTAVDDAERRDLDAERAGVYYDLADYAKAADAYKASLPSAADAAQASALRDGWARSLFRQGKDAEALTQYEQLLKAKPADSLPAFADRLMVFYLNFSQGKQAEREFPDDAQRLLLRYERLGEAQRAQLPAAELVRAGWAYYVGALVDLKKGRAEPALVKLNAAQNTPDDLLAGEVAYLRGAVPMRAKDYARAREAFEYLLFSARSAESAVRATYALGLCYQELGQPQKAAERFRALAERYPSSPYAALAEGNLRR